jgi:hypothetical protein
MSCRTTPVTLAPARSAGVVSVAKQSQIKVKLLATGTLRSRREEPQSVLAMT